MTIAQAEKARTARIMAINAHFDRVRRELDALYVAAHKATWDWFDSGAYRRKASQEPPLMRLPEVQS